MNHSLTYSLTRNGSICVPQEDYGELEKRLESAQEALKAKDSSSQEAELRKQLELAEKSVDNFRHQVWTSTGLVSAWGGG